MVCFKKHTDTIIPTCTIPILHVSVVPIARTMLISSEVHVMIKHYDVTVIDRMPQSDHGNVRINTQNLQVVYQHTKAINRTSSSMRTR